MLEDLILMFILVFFVVLGVIILSVKHWDR